MQKKKRCLRVLAVLAVPIACLLCFLLGMVAERKLAGFRDTDRNNTDLYAALLRASQEADVIPLDALVPVAWDRLKVFPSYCTAEQKTEYAGYAYADDLIDGETEGILSLLFLKDDRVVYHVDAIIPWRFRYVEDENGLVKMAIKGSDYWVHLEKEYVPSYESWRVIGQGSEFARSEKPAIVIEREEEGGTTIEIRAGAMER